MRRARLALGAAVGVLALLASACASSGASNTPSGSGPEKSHITVGTLSIVDAAPLFIAIHRGFFKQEGLTVTPQIIQSSPQSTGPLQAGTMDFSLLNYVSTFAIEENAGVKFRIVADSTQSAPNGFSIIVPKGSPITSVAALKGKKIAVPQLHTIGTLAVTSALRPYGVSEKQVTFVPLAFPDMLAAIKTHRVDAAWAVEPFITQMESVLGAHLLADTMTGAMESFPISGWGCAESEVQKYPKTVAAFQRAMLKAQKIAATDRKAVEQILPTYTKITPQVASIMTLDTYPTTLSAVRLQRVADLMQQLNYLPRHLNVAPMILALPKA